MAIDTYLIGNDGNVSFTVGGTTQSIFKVRSFAATLARPVSDLTSFGDTGRRKRLGMLDLSGTMNAVFGVDSTTGVNTAFWLFTDQAPSATAANDKRPALTLTLYDGTGTADAKIVANCVFSQFAFNATKDGDTTVTVNFENADGAAPVVSWLV